MFDTKGIMPPVQDFLCPVELLRLYDSQIGAVGNEPLRFVLSCPCTCEKIGNFLFSIDNFPGIKLIG